MNLLNQRQGEHKWQRQDGDDNVLDIFFPKSLRLTLTVCEHQALMLVVRSFSSEHGRSIACNTIFQDLVVVTDF